MLRLGLKLCTYWELKKYTWMRDQGWWWFMETVGPHPLSTKETRYRLGSWWFLKYQWRPQTLKLIGLGLRRAASGQCAHVWPAGFQVTCAHPSVHSLHTKDSYQGHRVMLKGFFLIEPSLLLVAVKFNWLCKTWELEGSITLCNLRPVKALPTW